MFVCVCGMHVCVCVCGMHVCVCVNRFTLEQHRAAGRQSIHRDAESQQDPFTPGAGWKQRAHRHRQSHWFVGAPQHILITFRCFSAVSVDEFFLLTRGVKTRIAIRQIATM